MEVEKAVPRRKVLSDSNPILRHTSGPIMELEGLDELVSEMLRAMAYPLGIGLAAPQVGELKRVIVVCIPHGNTTIHYEVANPEIYWTCKNKKQDWEGCFSYPQGFRALVPRYDRIKVRGFDRHGKNIQFGAKGLMARCIQHEVDHLDGILIVDRATRVDTRKADTGDASIDIGG